MAKTNSPRAGARRAVLAHLREIRNTVATLHGWWNVSARIYVPSAERGSNRNAELRDREPQEYPEAQGKYWASTVAEVDKMIAELGKLRAFAVTEFHKCEGR